uniref:Uncharacterized protein n=1 Tax=Medicago truncatula TaxID=3880 RepID=A2Q3F9_MEDTR|nr:hypothetical protein MtrDRAFT_AC155882g6v2 [Medicago truncatula]
MQNQQHPSSQNSQFFSPPTNSTVFPSPPPTNPNIFYRPQKDTQGVQFTHCELGTSIGSMSECQVPQFSTQVGLENISLVEKKRRSTQKKPRELFTRDEDILLIQTWLNISKVLLWKMIKKQKDFGQESLLIIISIAGSCERRGLVN